MSFARVVAVAPGSPAADAGFAPGDEILALNGGELRDVIEYRLAADEALVELDVRRGGLDLTVTVEKLAGTPLGLELESAVFDRVRTCDNHCPFCFIYQLPSGMRKSLSLKDDDYRLSFLYGNFTTLTRFTEADFERVVTERLSPLYVSIHATDPHVRAELLRNRRGATSLRWLELLLDAGIDVHGQVVVCPGVNDGEVLHDTLRGVLDRFAKLSTVGVVPLGVSGHSREPGLRAHTALEASAVLDTVDEWQSLFTESLGHRLVFASDEFYLLAGRNVPDADHYDGFAQHENGIGMARTFSEEVARALSGAAWNTERGRDRGFFGWVDGADETDMFGGRWTAVDGAPATGYRAPHGVEERLRGGDAPVTILTGELGLQVLEPFTESLSEHAGVEVRVQSVPNRFFGGNISVTGLLTGVDVAAALRTVPARDRVLLPDVVLSRGRFLDNFTPADLGRPVEFVATNGAALVQALS